MKVFYKANKKKIFRLCVTQQKHNFKFRGYPYWIRSESTELYIIYLQEKVRIEYTNQKHLFVNETSMRRSRPV